MACTCLDLPVSNLMSDFNIFRLMFESLVIRDLRIYVDYLDGSYAIFEVKLTSNGIEDAKKFLLIFYDNVDKKPKFMCIIVEY